MADETQRNYIELIWKSVDATSDVLKSMGKGVGQFGDNLASVTGPAASLTTGLLKVEAGVLALAAALGGLAINAAIGFESAAADLNKVLDESDGNLEQFKNQALEISDAFGVSATEVLKTAATFKEAGFSAADAFNLTREALTLTKISELDAAAASESLVAILKGFGSDVAEVPRIMDIINEVTNKYATGTVELTDALARVSPVAKQSGFTFEQTAATLTIMLEVFRKSELVTSAFNTTMVRLVSDTKDVAAGLDILGVSQTKANGTMKSGAEILGDVQKAFGGLPETQKLNVAAMLSGTDQGSKMVIVFDNLALSAKIVADALAGIGKSVKEEFEKRMQATEVLVDRLRVGFENLGIVVGTKLLPEFGGVVESGTKLINVFRKMIEEGKLDVFFAAINEQMENLNVVLFAVAENLPAAFAKLDFEPLLEQFRLLGVELGAIGGNIDLTTVDGLAKALQFVIDGIKQFVALNRGMIEVLPKVFAVLKDIGGILLSLDPQWVAIGGTILATLTVLDKAGSAFTVLGGIMSGLGIAVGGLNVALGALEVELGVIALEATGAVVGTAALAAGFGVLIGSLGNLYLNQSAVNKGFDSWGASLYYLTHDAIPPAIMSTREHAKAVAGWSLDIDQSIKSLGGFNVTLGTYNTTLGLATGKQSEAGASAQALSKEAQSLADAFTRAGQKAGNTAELAAAGFKTTTLEVRNTSGELVKITDVYTNVGNAAAAAADTMETALEKSFKATQAAKDKAEDFRLEWAKLESQERQLTFEVAGNIAVAQIEADASKVVAAFESISESVKSTGETINGLVESFAGIQSGKTFDKSFIESLIKEEMALRKQSFDLQKRLTDTQIRYLEASTERLKSGDALITIQGDGLKPALEMMMFEVLEAIQVKASSEGAAFLLGLPGV